MKTWAENLSKINGLWPDTNWTREESELYKKQCADLNQDWLALAIDSVRITYSSNKPTIKWLLEEYRKVKEDQRFKDNLLKERSKPMNDDNTEVTETDFKQMRLLIDSVPDEVQEAIAHKVYRVTGIKLDFSVPTEEWSRMKVAMAAAAIKRG